MKIVEQKQWCVKFTFVDHNTKYFIGFYTGRPICEGSMNNFNAAMNIVSN